MPTTPRKWLLARLLGAALWVLGLAHAAFFWAAGWGGIVWLYGGALSALLGGLLLARGRLPRRARAFLFLGMPAALLLASRGAYLAYQVPKYPTTYVLPDGYAGPVQVVFDENAPQVPRQENGRRVIAIDTADLAFVRAPFPTGYVDEQHVYQNGDSLRYLLAPNDSPPVERAVWEVTSSVHTCSSPFRRGWTPRRDFVEIVAFQVTPLPVP